MHSIISTRIVLNVRGSVSRKAATNITKLGIRISLDLAADELEGVCQRTADVTRHDDR
jgi:hypothetical protein